MKKYFRTLLLAASCLAILPAAGTRVRPWANQNKQSYKPGEVLVKPASRISTLSARNTLRARYGVASAETLGQSGLVKMKLAAGQDVEDTVAQLNRDGDVEFAQPNFIYHISSVPNDTSYSSLWGLKNTGQTVAGGTYTSHNPGTSGKDIGAEAAWSVTTDCSSITVAVLDTGVNYNHDDLATNMWDGGITYPNHGYNFVNSNDDPMDYHGHGTHVAGTIGAVGNNGLGTTGVCWTASIMAVRVLDALGSGTTADIVLGVDFARTEGAKVINMSLGGSSYDAAFNTALTTASNAGIVIVVAAGNDGTNNDSSGNAVYPCNYTTANLICVAALDQSFSLASFSNYGYSSVDVGAPGTNILSTWNGTETNTTDTFTTGWTSNDGTWTHNSVSLSGTTYDMLTNPATWNGTSTSYANNLDAQVYKQFDLSGASAAVLSYYAFLNTEASTDYFNLMIDSTGTDPFAGGGTQLDQLSGNTGTTAQSYSYDLAACRTNQCNIGFQLTSNASVVGRGVGILEFNLKKLVLDTTSYNTINGTSMATPTVAGLAALVYAYNPSYTAADVVASIKAGGTAAAALSAKSTTGKVVNALGSISYIATPTGVSATVQ